MFILTPSVTNDEALFRHAQQEATVSQWAFYIAKVPTYRVKEAGDGLSKATTGCVDLAMERFNGGQFSAIGEAKELAQRVVAMAGGTGSVAAERLADIRKEEDGIQSR